MRPGDTIEAEITRLGAQGDGLGQARAHPLYVPLALPGEKVKVKLTRSLGDGFQTELIEILTPSPARIAPPCPHFSHCGGCNLQHMNETTYAAHKQAVVTGALRQHKLDENVVRPLISIPGPTRRRLTIAAVHSAKGVILGFNARASATIIPITNCLVARPELVALFGILRTALAPWLVKAKALDISLTLASNGIDVLLTGPEPDLAAREAISALVAATIRVSWRSSERAMPEPMLVKEEPILNIAGSRLAYPAGVFLQPSVEGERVLLTQVQAALSESTGAAADLFSGLGTFALPLATTHEVSAYDSDGPALQALVNLRHPRLHTEQRDLFREPLNAKELAAFDAVILDPPRAGAQAQCTELAKSKVPVIAMVSCNPGTFARDALTLCSHGYTLNWVQPVDQFLWSHHVELVAQFTRG
jgi:23S rRNA (uracil1939-C5)-methyltransferase